MIRFLSDASRRELGTYLDADAIADLEAAISNLLAAPPPQQPTVRQAKEQLHALRAAALSLLAAIEDSPWVIQSLALSSVADGERRLKLNPDVLCEQLSALQASTSYAEEIIKETSTENNDSNRGRRVDQVVRSVVIFTLLRLTYAGVRLSSTPNGAAATCCSILFQDLSQLEGHGTRFIGASAHHHVREWLREVGWNSTKDAEFPHMRGARL